MILAAVLIPITPPTEIDPCDGTPCAVTGECLSSSPFNYTCLCDSGYTGQHCEVNIDDCVTATCPEDSDCVDGVESYSCVCHGGFVGENCTSLGGVTLEGECVCRVGPSVCVCGCVDSFKVDLKVWDC